jgi:protein-S-isoprenylcysteine O-methyltransferase Ste14
MDMNQDSDKHGAAVKFPPPLVFLTVLIIFYGINHFFPLNIGSSAVLSLISIAAVTIGFGIIIHVAFMFRRARTHIEPWKPTTTIITDGIYAYSRNPIYTGFCFIQIGLGLYLNSYWTLFSFLPAAFLVHHAAIRKEEIYLESKFGIEYLQYKNSVRCWI